MNQKISVIGGDARQIKVANALSDHGYSVLLTGFCEDKVFDKSIKIENDVQKAVEFADIIILPLPVSFDDVFLNTPLYDKQIDVCELMKLVPKNQLLLTGMISKKLKTLCSVYGIYDMDYFTREEMKILNAIPTAEGAIEIAMREMPITIHNSRTLVLGYGHVGKVVAEKLKGIGAKVTVSARKCADLATIRAYGYDGIKTEDVAKYIGEFDVIFNSIPAKILDREVLQHVNKHSIIIDLASKPGGVDFDVAKELNKKVIWALSLPGKVAPITAGEIIADTILNIIEELGV